MENTAPSKLQQYFQLKNDYKIIPSKECSPNKREKRDRPRIILKIKLPLPIQDLDFGNSSSKTTKSTVKKKKNEAKEKDASETKKKIVKKAEQEKEQGKSLKQSSIKSHFQVRRSGRRPKSTLKSERHETFMQKILNEDESGLEVRVLPEKGRGVFAAKDFTKGELVCEYAGELIDYALGLQREQEYSQNPDFGCYSYFFEYKNKKYCVDATKESDRLGRLLNHCRTSNNVCTQIFPIKDIPRLILVASRNIKTGEELVYDYGERNKEAVESHPWLKS